MNDRPPALPWPKPWCLCALLCLSCLVLGASQASALPPVQIDPSPGFLLVQAVKPGEQSGSEQQARGKQKAPFAELNNLLEDTQSKLDELFSATAIVAEQRKQIEALKEETERLAGELEQANTRRTELESSRKVAEGRIAELSKAIDVAVGETVRLDEELAGVRRQNADLEQRLARAGTAREAAQVEAEKTRTELQAKLEAATDAAEQSTAELAEVRKELERTGQELAGAGRMRQQVAARASEMEQALKGSGAEAERMKAELAELKEQLGQAASAAVEAERARQAASGEADQLRGEAARAREELAAAKGEIERFRTANAELEKQVASLHADSESAIETARQNLTVMEEKIEELHAGLVGDARSEGALPPRNPEGMANPVESDEPAAAALSSARTQPPAPERAAEPGAGQPTATAPELPTVAPDEAASETGSGLAEFRVSIQILNDLERSTSGVGLFSDIASVDDRAVNINATPAWDPLPPVAKETYLDTLLNHWVATKGGEGPAVVRIVDPSGRVLVEKSSP